MEHLIAIEVHAQWIFSRGKSVVLDVRQIFLRQRQGRGQIALRERSRGQAGLGFDHIGGLDSSHRPRNVYALASKWSAARKLWS